MPRGKRCPCVVRDYNLHVPLATEACGDCEHLDRTGTDFDTMCRCPRRKTLLYPSMPGVKPLLARSRHAPPVSLTSHPQE
jgi:hypothetical protein